MDFGHIKVAAIDVHAELGPGLTECLYQNALAHALRELGCKVECEVVLPIKYREHIVGYLRQDIIVEDTLCLELKAKAALSTNDAAQALSYLKHNPQLESCMLINFGREVTFSAHEKKNVDVA